MAEKRDPQTAQRDEDPGKQPPLRRRLWARTGLGEKTLWDLLQLLIIPLVLAVIGFWFTAQQQAHQQEVEEHRAQVEREIEAQRAEQVTLQAYLDQMGTLLLDRDLRTAAENSDVRRLARARTLVVLDALGSDRLGRALRFLVETELIQARPPDRPPIISLKYASLRNFELTGKQLLKDTDLTQATLYGADLTEANLEGTDLSGAHLSKADLSDANLRGAKLSGAYLNDTDLSGADLNGADLSDAQGRFESGARMSGAHLEGADLSGADLTNAEITKDQLQEAGSLEGATMPDGSKHS
jgi:pentapeptide repeat protein